MAGSNNIIRSLSTDDEAKVFLLLTHEKHQILGISISLIFYYIAIHWLYRHLQTKLEWFICSNQFMEHTLNSHSFFFLIFLLQTFKCCITVTINQTTKGFLCESCGPFTIWTYDKLTSSGGLDYYTCCRSADRSMGSRMHIT